jgi:hypothetical protein
MNLPCPPHSTDIAAEAELAAGAIIRFHDAALTIDASAAGPSAGGGPWHWLRENHRFNRLLWDEEDQARRTDVPDAFIAACKRRIDACNQRRNDAVEAIDQELLEILPPPPASGARQHSETAGAMVDRLSILALKIHHMALQAARADGAPAHAARCAEKLATLRRQRADLGRCLDGLLAEARGGTAFFNVYRQHKMYNDPELNPCLARGPPGDIAA